MIVQKTFKRSVKLTEKQVLSLRKRMNSYPNHTEASIGIGVGREVLLRILAIGSCSEITYKKLFNHNKS